MPVQPLPSLPAGSDVFLDANIFVYGLSGVSAECRALLHRCSEEQVTGISSYHVVSEVTHRLMCIEAQSKGLAGARPRETLNEHPERVRQLTDYWSEIERLLSLNILFLGLDEGIIRAANKERELYGLLNNDSLIVASMRNYGLSRLASRDAGFRRISHLTLYSPSDV
jgi:predicted nucleic acid-binding protein